MFREGSLSRFTGFKRLVLLSTLLLWGCAYPVWGKRSDTDNPPSPEIRSMDPQQAERFKRLDTLFDHIEEDIVSELRDAASYRSDTSALYNLQQNLTLFLDYMVQVKSRDHLDRLARMLLIPLNHLQIRNTYWAFKPNLFYRLDGYKEFPFPEPRLMWVKSREVSNPQAVIAVEDFLENSQFLYLISRSIHQFLTLEPQWRTRNMEAVIDQYAEVVLTHTYKRWIVDDTPQFQVRGWGCGNGLYTHRAFLEKKLARAFDSSPSYCNQLGDDDMWVVTGLVEMLAAHALAPERVRIDPALKAEFESYLQLAMRLIRSRFTETELTDFNGRPVQGYNFDAGVWKDHEDHLYAGYTGKKFPRKKHAAPVDGVSWDLAHMSRIVYVLNTLMNNKSITGSAFPDRQDMRKMANQLAYRIFSGTLELPLFNNYWDGSNGWYRVGYAGNKGFAYGPHGLTYEVIRGGYCRWKHHNPDLGSICDSLWKVLSDPDGEQRRHRKNRIELCEYQDFIPARCDDFNPYTSYGLFNFIAAYDGADPPLRPDSPAPP